jgi:beta-glucosidase
MENDRFAYDSIISQRALREIYLMPFMITEKYARPWAYVCPPDVLFAIKLTYIQVYDSVRFLWLSLELLQKAHCSYNRVNGTHLSENPLFIQSILRGEWRSSATVMSDWFGMYSVSESINAGLDLEMPGEQKWRQHHLVNRALFSKKVTIRTVKERARKVLELVKKCCAGAPEVSRTLSKNQARG